MGGVGILAVEGIGGQEGNQEKGRKGLGEGRGGKRDQTVGKEKGMVETEKRKRGRETRGRSGESCAKVVEGPRIKSGTKGAVEKVCGGKSGGHRPE